MLNRLTFRFAAILSFLFLAASPSQSGQHATESTDPAPIFLQRAAMIVTDLDASLAFYQDVLGLTLTSRSDYSSENFRTIFKVPEGVVTEFALLDAKDRQPRPIGLVEIDGVTSNVEANRTSAPAIVFGTEDMDGIYARAKEAKIEIQLDPSPLIGFSGDPIGREMSMYDPDGVRVILFEIDS